MKTLRTPVLLVIATLGIASLQAQTADEIISKHVTALGGKDVLNSIKSVYVESSIDIQGNAVPCITYILNGKGCKNEMDFNGQKIVQCVTDKGGWAVNPMMGATTPTAMPDDQVKASQSQLEIGGPLFEYATKGNKVELAGKDTTGGANAYKIKLTTKDAVVITFYIDAGTYYITKAVSKFSVGGQDVEMTSAFSDYRKTDQGYVLPYAQQQMLPQFTLNITTNKVEINKAIDPTIFDMPK